MVGSGSTHVQDGTLKHFSAVLKLNYRNRSGIITSLVRGTLESSDVMGSLNYFEPVSVMGVSLTNQDFSLVQRENENMGFSAFDCYENVSLRLNRSPRLWSSLVSLSYGFDLEYASNCSSSANCNPLGESSDTLPNFMSFSAIRLLERKGVRAMIQFSNSSIGGRNLPFDFDPNSTLVAEGVLDEKKNRLCFVGCRFFNFTESLANAFLGDCSFKLCLRFPATVSLRNRSTAVGQIWSNRTVDDMGYFGRIMFQNSGERILLLPGLKYGYSEIDKARAFCLKMKTGKSKGKTYPHGFSPDMRFDMSVRDRKGQIASGHVSPLAVGEQFYQHDSFGVGAMSEKPVFPNISHSSLLNISYRISFISSPALNLGSEIYSTTNLVILAEGTYDTKTGVVCLIACRQLRSYNKSLSENDSTDCEIHMKIQYPPLNGKGIITGTIQSTRRKHDPHYFDTLDFSSNSIYMNQAVESIWRMDLEIIMVLVSNTLACVFVGLQLFYGKRHPDVLPFVSIMMLIVLTLGHMIPLLLNFEALFVVSRNRQNVFLGSGGWLEVNEVIVRVVTMIAFLLQFRLLQLTWTSRGGDESKMGLWSSEKRVFYSSLPLCVGGGVLAWFVHRWKSSHLSPFLFRHASYQQYSFWGTLRSYAGLVLDGFLLPQIMFNLFADSKDKALTPPFYVGTTVVRLLPHAYDLYRAHSTPWSFGLSSIYANPKMDFYSTAWDVIIPCCGLLFVALIYLQQRFGGRSILPKGIREKALYEKAPVVSDD